MNSKISEVLRIYIISSIKENTDKARKYGIYRYIRTYKKMNRKMEIIYIKK
ncbi:hypothetical protein HMPREF9333_01168 [Johnsonella ignava ATCC 51276]|uniref:Uncharacterized protein n=1 Tax=Johnsonella ignava ATCC 51276 TaxID=679200 RepID=G5GHX8_9FIRM|nr:hypothetical protein HMPREF9333_01168 [Johnsonella ignava ATCC 51276]